MNANKSSIELSLHLAFPHIPLCAASLCSIDWLLLTFIYLLFTSIRAKHQYEAFRKDRGNQQGDTGKRSKISEMSPAWRNMLRLKEVGQARRGACLWGKCNNRQQLSGSPLSEQLLEASVQPRAGGSTEAPAGSGGCEGRGVLDGESGQGGWAAGEQCPLLAPLICSPRLEDTFSFQMGRN